MGVYTGKQKVYTGTVKNESLKFCRFNYPCCNSCTFKISQKHLFSRGVKQKKLEIAVFPSYLLLLTPMPTK